MRHGDGHTSSGAAAAEAGVLPLELIRALPARGGIFGPGAATEGNHGTFKVLSVAAEDRPIAVGGEHRRSGSFRRSFTLPIEVDEGNVDAKFEHGVLNITLPKTEKAAPKKIEVKG